MQAAVEGGRSGLSSRMFFSCCYNRGREKRKHLQQQSRKKRGCFSSLGWFFRPSPGSLSRGDLFPTKPSDNSKRSGPDMADIRARPGFVMRKLAAVLRRQAAASGPAPGGKTHDVSASRDSKWLIKYAAFLALNSKRVKYSCQSRLSDIKTAPLSDPAAT